MTNGRINRRDLRRARPEDVRRFARWLKLKNIDGMSHKQLIKLIDWLLKRREKKLRGMTWDP